MRLELNVASTWATENGTINLIGFFGNDDDGICARAWLALDRAGFFLVPCDDGCEPVPLGPAPSTPNAWATFELAVTVGASGTNPRLVGSLVTDQRRVFDVPAHFSQSKSATLVVGAATFGQTPRATVNVDNILLDLAN